MTNTMCSIPDRLGVGRILFRAAERDESVEAVKAKPAPETALSRRKRRRVNGFLVVDEVEVEPEFAPLARLEMFSGFMRVLVTTFSLIDLIGRGQGRGVRRNPALGRIDQGKLLPLRQGSYVVIAPSALIASTRAAR